MRSSSLPNLSTTRPAPDLLMRTTIVPSGWESLPSVGRTQGGVVPRRAVAKATPNCGRTAGLAATGGMVAPFSQFATISVVTPIGVSSLDTCSNAWRVLQDRQRRWISALRANGRSRAQGPIERVSLEGRELQLAPLSSRHLIYLIKSARREGQQYRLKAVIERKMSLAPG